MRTLVTGSEGFVGSHLVAYLTARGQEVVGTSLSAPEGDGTGVERKRLDVLDEDAVRHVVASVRPRVVFHLAGFSSGALARRHPREAVKVNALGTLSIVHALADAAGDATLVVTGSGDAYGTPGADALDESAPTRPTSVYGASKAAQEAVALGVGRALGVDVRVARMFPLIGPGQGDAFVVPSFCRQAAEIAAGRADPVLSVGNLDVERDFLEVSDGVAALAALGSLEATRFEVYNVCSGRGVTIRTLLEWVVEAAGIDPEIRVDPARVRPDEPDRIVGTAERLRAETGWEPAGDVREGVRGVYSWVQRSGEVH